MKQILITKTPRLTTYNFTGIPAAKIIKILKQMTYYCQVIHRCCLSNTIVTICLPIVNQGLKMYLCGKQIGHPVS
ncbi:MULTISPECIES: hypothetical protein [unclassified Mucilaginibacter]|uniref:hypothetical protein n=1 Tax=unclassified Mucilaginibacter TaxID=2617802 RepID=UPI0031F660BE